MLPNLARSAGFFDATGSDLQSMYCGAISFFGEGSHDTGMSMVASEESRKVRVSKEDAWRAVARRLSLVAELTREETNFLRDCGIAVQKVNRGSDIFVEGESQANILLCLQGWGARYRILADGRRQIVDFILPGSLFGSHVDQDDKHAISAESLHEEMYLAVIGDACIRRIAEHHVNIASRIVIALADESVRLLERVVSLGRRDARQRLGHFLLELNERLKDIETSRGVVVGVPIPQTEVADFLGLTSVHVSRTLNQMRDEEFIDYDDEFVTILRPAELAELCEFERQQVLSSAIPRQLCLALLNCD